MRERIEAYIVREPLPKRTGGQVAWDWAWRIAFTALWLMGILAGLMKNYDRGGYLIALAILIYVTDEKGRL